MTAPVTELPVVSCLGEVVSLLRIVFGRAHLLRLRASPPPWTYSTPAARDGRQHGVRLSIVRRIPGTDSVVGDSACLQLPLLLLLAGVLYIV